MTDLKEIFCQQCGEKNEASAKFCNECGKPIGKSKTVDKDTSAPKESGSVLGVVSLTTGILGFCCLPGIGWIIAIITGYLTPDARENSYAKAGMSIGVFSYGLSAFGGGLCGLIFYFVDLFDESGSSSLSILFLILGLIGILTSITLMVLFIRWFRKKPSPT
ncbi:MAG: zinc-ribbon domain-containing protein [Candidatus Heimdallarchaeota archaeon]